MADNNDQATDTDTDDSKPDKNDAKSFTQADVDRIVQERLARAKPPADYDDLKAAAQRLEEIEAANKSDLEKAQTRADEAEKRAEQAQNRANDALRRAAVMSAATTAGAIDADAVIAMLDQDAVTIGDDGQVTGAEEAVKALLESKPYLVGTSNGEPVKKSVADGGQRGAGGDGRPTQLTRDDISTMSSDEIEAARVGGQLADLMSGG